MTKIYKTIVLRKEFYRLWFEFYKMSLHSSDPKILRRLDSSLKIYYQWGDVKNSHFDDWWNKHEDLFEEESVRVLTKEDLIEFDSHIVLQIPVNQSVSDLLKNVRTVLNREHKLKNTRKKNKSISTSQFLLTDGSEPKLSVLKDVLYVYRDVYLKYPKLKGKNFREKVYEFYETNFKKRTSLPPTIYLGSTTKQESQRVNRNLRRWIDSGKKIQLNVLNGEFPGKY
jgi:hypothetical protein